MMAKFYPVRSVRRTVGRSRFQLAKQHTREFLENSDPEFIESAQMRLFNQAWKEALELPFYQEWQRKFQLPNSVSSLEEIKAWPPLHKSDLRDNIELVKMTPGVVGSYRTSGSTSEPFDFPRGEDEFAQGYSTMWSYRSAHGLYPFDPFLAVANTSTGAAQSWWSQKKSRLSRILKDLAGNSWKTDGFIPTGESADKALTYLKLTRAKYVVGFPSGIAAMARRAEEQDLKFPKLTHAILSSETIEDADVELIERAFQVKVLIEYGAVELGVVAGTFAESTGWPLKVHWWSNLLRLDSEGAGLITTLEGRAFPLINYAIGDLIEPGECTPGGSLLSIDFVHGRTRDVVSIETSDGGTKTLSARGLTYLVRDLPAVTSIQVAQLDDDKVELLVVATGADKALLINKISKSILRNRRELSPGAVTVSFIEQHVAGARGKRGVLVSRGDLPLDRKSIPLITK